MKKCRICRKYKKESEFYIRKSRNKLYDDCKKCNNKSATIRLQNYRKECVEYLGGKCIVCGYNRYIGALEFHHKNPREKDVSFNRMKNWSFEKRKEELDKCILVCSNCHREIEAKITSF